MTPQALTEVLENLTPEQQLANRLKFSIRDEGERIACTDLRNPKKPVELSAEDRRKALATLWNECLRLATKIEEQDALLELHAGFCDSHKNLEIQQLAKIGALNCPACTGTELAKLREQSGIDIARLELQVSELDHKVIAYDEAEAQCKRRGTHLLEEHAELGRKVAIQERESERMREEMTATNLALATAIQRENELERLAKNLRLAAANFIPRLEEFVDGVSGNKKGSYL